MIFGTSCYPLAAHNVMAFRSFEPDADVNCERLLEQALQVYPGNSEALQSLANVRLSQQRPDDARKCLEQSWTVWKDLDIGAVCTSSLYPCL